MTRAEWLAYGQSRGWVSQVWCWTHDCPPLNDEEVQVMEEDADALCISALRYQE